MSPSKLLLPVRKTSFATMGALVCAAVVATSPVPSLAQDNTEARLRRAEAEIRALQRAVFPGGDGRFFEPQITADGTATGPTTSTRPSTTAVTDILARLDAIEAQLQRLTAITEENANSVSLLEARVEALEARPVGPAPEMIDDTGATDSNLSAMTAGASQDGAGSTRQPPRLSAPVGETTARSPSTF